MKYFQNTKTANGCQSAVVVDRLRPCEIKTEERSREKYLFHCWIQSNTMALIEDANGNMSSCSWGLIKFLDRE